MPKTVVAIIGRPNVGKSTLFNRLLGKRKDIVEDLPGTTVDRIHSDISWEGHDLTLVDCGGLEARPGASIRRKVRDQVDRAVAEVDLVLFMVDGRDGVLPADQETADIIRRARKPTILVVNKVDTPKQEAEVLQFYELAMGDPIAVSAYHHRGIEELMQKVIGKLPVPTASVAEPESMKIAIVGRPNVGKSLLLNTLLGEERVVVDEVAGTTRDTIDTVMQYKGERLTLIDTAGIRRRGRIDQGIERYSSQRTDDAIERADIALLVVDAVEGITAQDIHILGFIHKGFKGAILVVFEILEFGTSRMNGRPIEPQKAASIREQFEITPNLFTVILVGKDGGINLKRNDQVRLEEIFRLIDSMPMRQDEMRQKGRNF